jgi:ribosomal protein S18 acetylase RimI-like enzyme
VIRQLSRSELGIVRDLAHHIWPLVYSSMISPEQMSYMLEWMYNPDVLASEFDKGASFHTFQKEGKDIAYLHLEPVGDFAVKLQKLYVHPQYHGQEIGKQLVMFTVAFTREQGRSLVELQVNRSNPAVAFYRKLGFEVVDEQDFDIGNGYFMNDYVMQLEV